MPPINYPRSRIMTTNKIPIKTFKHIQHERNAKTIQKIEAQKNSAVKSVRITGDQ